MRDAVKLPELKLRSNLHEEVVRKAEVRGMALPYYLLSLVGRDLGYLKAGSSEQEVRKWLRGEKLRGKKPSKAAQALLDDGGTLTTAEIAERADLSYQQAYRQLGRSPLVEKQGSSWRPRPHE